eukprot:TRINITY_DN4069_c0_g1_i1.p1 TRINITY_DN4069_c0_g1~~TRINITY_DN4069_c0_g1_i1.p1  ORF type:complete len:139 (+),score=24.22 TRINITY_DN4069_c0_g1_i1:259-675(+)
MLAMRHSLSSSETTVYHPVLAGDFNLCPDSVVYKVITGVELNESEDDNDLLAFLTPEDHSDENSNDLEKVVNDGIVGWKGYKRQPTSEQDRRRLMEVRDVLSNWYDKTRLDRLPTLRSSYGRYSDLRLGDITRILTVL